MGLEGWKSKKDKKLIDYIFLLFKFEKKYFEKENIKCEFVGHPLLEQEEKSIDESETVIKKKSNYFNFSWKQIIRNKCFVADFN